MVILMDEREVRRRVSQAGLRVTYPRLALLTELSRSHTHPKSAAELTATLSQFPRSSVYRNLEVLESVGLIKSSLIKWVRRYELGDVLTPHHHHLSCTQCGRLIDFDSSKLEDRLQSIARDHQFQLTSHVVELRGLCSNCHEPPTSAAFNVLSLGIESVKKLRPTDPLMEKLRREDTHQAFDPDRLDTEQTHNHTDKDNS